MEFLWIIIYTLVAYLIGSIPTSLWFGKLYFGLDIRDHGNGTSSHLNVKQIMGSRASMLIRLMDFAKGLFAARLSVPLSHQIDWLAGGETYILTLSLGLAAILGHIFPAFTRFRGGKGFYVALGVSVVAHPAMMSVFLGVTILAYVVSNRHYLSYLIGSLSLPLFIYLTRSVWYEKYLPMMLFAILVFFMLMITHAGAVSGSTIRIRRPDSLLKRLNEKDH